MIKDKKTFFSGCKLYFVYFLKAQGPMVIRYFKQREVVNDRSYRYDAIRLMKEITERVQF
jgi:hypothetical protein